MALSPGEARDTGRNALLALRKSMAERLVSGIERRDPDLLSSLAEVGLVRRAFVEDPSGEEAISAPPVEVLQRMLERSVERRPSLFASLGLSAIQLLASTPASGDGGVSERLAVVFTDLENFTRWTARNGDDAASALLADHHRVVGPVVRSRGGKIVKRLGDGLLLTFPEPEAAVLAGLELVNTEPGPLRLRAGVNVGDVVVMRDDVIGHEVNVAARVAESARGGQVLVTEAVRGSAGTSLPAVKFGRLRRRRYKGLPDPVGVCAATPAAAESSGAGAPE